MKVYKALAHALLARKNCEESGNAEWYARHGESTKAIMQTAPSGSGIDMGTKLHDDSTEKILAFTFSYHHMNDEGMYTEWSNFLVVVRASLWSEVRIDVCDGTEDEVSDEYGELCDLRVYGHWYVTEGGCGDGVARESDEHLLEYLHQVFDAWLNEEWEPPKGSRKG